MEKLNRAQRDFKGIWIPKEIWFDENLSPLEKVILAEIDSLDNENHCSASNAYFANFCQCTERKVSDTISKLIDLGYIEIISFNGRTRIISSKIHEISSSLPRKKFYADQKKVLGSIEKNSTYYNSNNKITNKIDKTISEDIVEETSNNTNSISQNSKDTKYNPILEIMDNNKYVSKTKKKNKYEQGMDIIDNYTNNDILKEKLVIYLKFRLENKEKPMYINQWKGIVAKLDTLASDLDTQVKIVQQSIDRGYLGFYPLTTYNKQPQKKFIDDQVTVKIENEDISNERF